MLKLFRDYAFHQVMEDGRPFLDMAHVIACLNRLDAGIPDKVRAQYIIAIILEPSTNLREVAQCPEKALLEQLRSIKMLNRIFNMVSMGHLFVKTITDGRL